MKNYLEKIKYGAKPYVKYGLVGLSISPLFAFADGVDVTAITGALALAATAVVSVMLGGLLVRSAVKTYVFVSQALRGA
jgi:hypothetical protein